MARTVLELDFRPSVGITIAACCGAPNYVLRQLLEQLEVAYIHCSDNWSCSRVIAAFPVVTHRSRRQNIMACTSGIVS